MEDKIPLGWESNTKNTTESAKLEGESWARDGKSPPSMWKHLMYMEGVCSQFWLAFSAELTFYWWRHWAPWIRCWAQISLTMPGTPAINYSTGAQGVIRPPLPISSAHDGKFIHYWVMRRDLPHTSFGWHRRRRPSWIAQRSAERLGRGTCFHAARPKKKYSIVKIKYLDVTRRAN